MQSWIYKRTQSYIGKRFGRLTVVAIAPRDKHRHIKLECTCSCGGTKVALLSNIKRGATQSCGCLHREVTSAKTKERMGAQEVKDRIRKKALTYREGLVGKKFSRLTILAPVPDSLKKVLCKCDCGKTITTYYSNLFKEHTRSCGCAKIYRHPERDVGLRKLYYRYTFRAKKTYETEFTLTLEEFKKLTSANCTYCGSPPGHTMLSRSTHSSYVYNGIDRVDSCAGYTLENTVTSCEICNKMKLDHSRQDFISHVHKIARFSKDGC